MSDCLFCKIINRDIPATLIYEDSQLVAFQDVNPQAPMHILVVPKRHIATLNDLTADDDGIIGSMVRRATVIANDQKYGQAGYRTVFNCNADGGQTVFHIHLHLLGGRTMAWPPG